MSNYRKRKGDQGERTVLVLLEQAGWIANNGSPTTPGVDVIAYWDWGSSPGAFAVLHAEAKNEPWRRRGRSYLGPIAAYWEAKGVLYRVFTHERAGWFVRAISYQDGRVRTLYMEPATVASCCLGGLLMAGKSPPSSSPPSTAKVVLPDDQNRQNRLERVERTAGNGDRSPSSDGVPGSRTREPPGLPVLRDVARRNGRPGSVAAASEGGAWAKGPGGEDRDPMEG